MSFGYSSFPATKGKVILKSSGGDLEIELWPKEAPLACRNFVQLCMEGYYDNIPIHRIVPKFIVQTGDPTGTGLGGESIYGKPFKDEFHSRLKFSTRGLLAMANTGPNTNQSQFFFTLDATPGLNGKNTIFGKVVGDTLFNVLRIGELETDKEDRPIYDARIFSADVIANPFDDIEPRTTREEKRLKEEAEKKRLAEEERLNKPKGKKNLKLLSFGEEASIDENAPKLKIKSSHDLVNDARLSKEVAQVSTSESKSKKRKVESEDEGDEDYDQKMREKLIQKKITAAEPDKALLMQEQIKKLQGEIKQIGAPKKKVEQQPKQPKTLVEKFREEYLKSGKAMSAIRKDKGSVDEKLNSFASHLKQVEKQPKAAVKKVSVAPESNWECSLHFIKNCSSCRDTFGEQISDDEDDWMSATLHFPKQVGANVYEPKIDDYTVVDPRQGYFILTSAKADPFGRDIQVLGDIKSRQKVIWTEKSTRTVKSLTEQFIEQPDFIRE